MKREMNLKEIQLRMGLSVIAYDSLTQLQRLTHSDQREAAEQLAARIVMLLQQRHIDFGLCSTAPVAHLYIEAEPAAAMTTAKPAAVRPAAVASANTDWVLTPERGTEIMKEMTDLRIQHPEMTGKEILRKHGAKLYSAPEPERYMILCLLGATQFKDPFFTKRNDVQGMIEYAKKTTKCKGISAEYWQNRGKEWCRVAWPEGYANEADFRKHDYTKLWEKFAPAEFTSLALQQLQDRVKEAVAA